jgi:hypothetical protein
MIWVRHAAQKEETRNFHKTVGNTERERLLEEPRHTWYDDTKTEIQEEYV